MCHWCNRFSPRILHHWAPQERSHPAIKQRLRNIIWSEDSHSSKSPPQTFFLPQIYKPSLFYRLHPWFPSHINRQLPPTPQKRKSFNLSSRSHPLSPVDELLFYRYIFHNCILFSHLLDHYFQPTNMLWNLRLLKKIISPKSPSRYVNALFYFLSRVFFLKGRYIVLSNSSHIYL